MMWSIVKSKVALKNPQNRKSLKIFVQEAWDSIDQQIVIRAIDKLKEKVCKKVLEKQGDWV